MQELAGQCALVTGASRGIGAATAMALAGHGVAVVLAARSAADIERVASGIRDDGGRAVAVVCDVSRHADVERAVGTCEANFGAVDLLVNNAGIIEPIARLAESDPHAWDTCIDINVKGVYHAMRAVLPAMVARGTGVIVNVSSGAASGALEGWSHYSASKAAVASLTRTAHKEYAAHGVRVVGLSPGTVATGMQVAIKASGLNPVSALDPNVHIPPQWAAQAICWLATGAAAAHAGTDFALQTEEGMRAVGLA